MTRRCKNNTQWVIPGDEIKFLDHDWITVTVIAIDNWEHHWKKPWPRSSVIAVDMGTWGEYTYYPMACHLCMLKTLRGGEVKGYYHENG